MGSRLLELLEDGDRRTVLATATRRRFKRNEIVFHDGDPGDTLHLITKGHFTIRISTPLGDVATLRVLGPGEHFGELAVLEPGPRRGTVVSLDAGETQSLHRDDFTRLRETMPKIEQVLTQALVAEVRRLAGALVDALYVPAERRVWRRLNELVELYAEDSHVVVPLTQDDLAQLAGTTRPTANRVLHAGEDQGVVSLARGRIEIHDVPALQRLARS